MSLSRRESATLAMQHQRCAGHTQRTHPLVQELVSAKDQPALRTEKCKFGGDVVPPAALAAAYEQSTAHCRCL